MLRAKWLHDLRSGRHHFAYLLQTLGKLATDVLLSATLANPLVVMVIALLVAAAFGLVSLFLAGKLSAKAAA